MSDFEKFGAPISPGAMDWSAHFPDHFQIDEEGKPVQSDKLIRFADIGCGFGGLTMTLSEMFPDKLTLGLEIRASVVDIVYKRIQEARAEHKSESDEAPGKFNNISVLRTNFMKYAANYFYKGQLEKLFFLFADPHFKQGNYRRRIINPNFCAIYAYILKVGGILYTITDVKDLHDWQVQHLTEHPCFERLSEEEEEADPLVKVIANCSEEGLKVSRLKGSKFPALFRRIEPKDKKAQPNETERHLKRQKIL